MIGRGSVGGVLVPGGELPLSASGRFFDRSRHEVFTPDVIEESVHSGGFVCHDLHPYQREFGRRGESRKHAPQRADVAHWIELEVAHHAVLRDEGHVRDHRAPEAVIDMRDDLELVDAGELFCEPVAFREAAGTDTLERADVFRRTFCDGFEVREDEELRKTAAGQRPFSSRVATSMQRVGLVRGDEDHLSLSSAHCCDQLISEEERSDCRVGCHVGPLHSTIP